MKILMIGTDKKIFEDGSEARQRMIEYGRLAEQLYIIVFTKRIKNLQRIALSENTFLYPTNSFSRWCYIFDAVKIAKKIIENSGGKFLITSQDPFEIGLAGWLVARKFKIPLQLQIHTDFLNSYFRQESFLNKIRVRLAKFLISRAACVRVVSERIKSSLNSNPPAGGQIPNSKISVLPIFIDAEKIKNAPIKTDLRRKYPQFDFIILTASRLTAEKNIGLAVEAMAEVIKDYPKIGLIIAGNGPEKENLESKISNLKINENIIIEDWADDLASYYKTADLFLLTSNYEGYGRTLIEAAVSGCRVISSDVGVADEILPKENIFEVGNKEQLKEKILKAVRGELKMPNTGYLAKMPTKEEYLRAYKKLWEDCGKTL